MARNASRPGSSSWVLRTSSRSCLIIEPMRMTLAGSETYSLSSSPAPSSPTVGMISSPCSTGGAFMSSVIAVRAYRSARIIGPPDSSRADRSRPGGEEGYEHLFGGQRTVPTDQHIRTGVVRIEEGDRLAGHERDVTQPLPRDRGHGRPEPTRVDRLG